MNELMLDREFNYDLVLERTSSLAERQREAEQQQDDNGNNGQSYVDQVKSVIASLLFIISNSARFNVQEATLSLELQQIGFPKDSAETVCTEFSRIKSQLVQTLKTKTVRLPKIESCKWRVDFILSSSKLKQVNEPSIQLELNIVQRDKSELQSFDVSLDQFRVLHHELATARKLMDRYQAWALSDKFL